jgi:hypothetical protein
MQYSVEDCRLNISNFITKNIEISCKTKMKEISNDTPSTQWTQDLPWKNPIRKNPNQKVRALVLFSFLLHCEMQVQITGHSLWRCHGQYGQYGCYRISFSLSSPSISHSQCYDLIWNNTQYNKNVTPTFPSDPLFNIAS